jgi:photosystem II stability/assembly factor-like uncharacterized protein
MIRRGNSFNEPRRHYDVPSTAPQSTWERIFILPATSDILRFRNHAYCRCLLLLPLLLLLNSCKAPDNFHYSTIYRGHSVEGLNARSLVVISDAVIVAGPKGVFCGRFFSGDLVEQPAIEGAEDIRDMHLFNDGTMVLMNSGNNGTIYHVAFDGTQTKVYDTAAIFLDGLDFWDDRSGIAFGDPLGGKFFLLRTDNSGKNWHNLTPPSLPVARPGEGAFAASGTSIQCLGDSTVYFVTGMGDTARMFCSYDRGLSWSVKNTPVKSGSNNGIYSMYFWSETEGIIAGGNWEDTKAKKKICYYTADGGNTWINRSKGLGGYTSCIQGNENGTFLCATGDQGTYYSLDKGLNWELMFERNFYSMAVTDDYLVLIGRDGVLEVLMYKF